MTNHEQKQDNYIIDLERLLHKIRNARAITGDNPKNKEQIDAEIISISSKLDHKHYQIFEDMLN